MLELYKNIKKKRIELGWSQDDLAKKTGYSDRTSISKIESGKVDLNQTKIVDFAKAFGISPGELMGWDNSEYIQKQGRISRVNEKEDDYPKTIAAHHDGEDWTEEELEDIEMFKELLRKKRERK